MGTDDERQIPMSSVTRPNFSGKEREREMGRAGLISDQGEWRLVTWAMPSFKTCLWMSETSSKVVPFDGAGRGSRVFSRLHGTLKTKDFHCFLNAL